MTDPHKKAEWQANQVEKWSGLNIRREAANTIRDLSTRLAKKDAALLAAEELADAMEWLGEWQAYDASSTSFPVKPPSPDGTTDEAKKRLIAALTAFRAAMEDTP